MTRTRTRTRTKVDPAPVQEEPVEDASDGLEDDNETRIIHRYKGKVKNPLSGIRAHCVECMGGAPQSVAECPSVFPVQPGQKASGCSLWPFRMGKNTMDKRAGKPRPKKGSKG